MEQNINSYVHKLLLNHINPTSYCIYATCGNGFDTVFLAKHCHHVYAIDIQDKAIEETTKLLRINSIQNVTVIQASHNQLQQIVPIHTKVQIIMYNLGYLPHGDHSIVTTPKGTVESLTQAIELLEPKGFISIILYVGHEGGQQEANAVEAFCVSLDKKAYTVFKTEYLNRLVTPYVILIQKE